MEFSKAVERAFKKLKASVYYDKTQLVLRNKIVQYESKGINYIKKDFEIISNKLNESDDEWEKSEKLILDSIKTLTFPKKIKSESNSIIINDTISEIVVEKQQHFIDMNIHGHLLGILWVMYVGKYIDDDMYECSYGNRLDEKLLSDESGEYKFSNRLFKPYFTQYENWRDYGLEKAQEQLKLSNDAIILTMDFSSFFYSINYELKDFEDFFERYREKVGEHEDNRIIRRINSFVYKVLVNYSGLFKDKYDSRIFLPIGFFPSNILSNSYLDKFDSVISTRWNPLYYGRYVDDIIIVDKVEKNSDLYYKIDKGSISEKEVIEYFLCKCNADKINECQMDAYLLKSQNSKYIVNKKFLNNEKGEIEVNNDKVKVFYFKHNCSDALISKFKKAISQNKSEFRYMPEDNNILEAGDYSEIYDLKYSDSINKLSGVKGVSVDKYALSKFLGKYLRVGGIINDSKESMFTADILKIFNKRVIIENYTLWEKVIEILIINNEFSILNDFVELIVNSFRDLIYSKTSNIRPMKSSLLEVLYSGLCKGFALNWGLNSKKCIEYICKVIQDENIEKCKSVSNKFTYNKILKMRQAYCHTRMIDKNAMPSLIDLILTSDEYKIFDDRIEVNLSSYQQYVKCIEKFEFQKINYFYYPYIISPQDIQMASVICDMKLNVKPKNPLEMNALINKLYFKLNYNLFGEFNNYEIPEIDSMLLMKTDEYDTYAIKVNNKIKKDKLKVALANVRVFENDFIDVLTNIPKRSYDRYKILAAVVREAISNKVDMLVFPESYLPIEWLPLLMSISVKSQIVIVTGIEHVISGNEVYNLTATILPFQYEGGKYAYLNMHSKVVFSPDEKFTLEGYRYKCNTGNRHELFCWNNIWFPVYCCYEVASIRTRAMFQSIADLVVTIEWNHDVNYYSNIIESLNRDLHCYCIQVNTSDYGDSRLIKPSKTENKDIIRIKGGINGTAIIDEIDIKLIRDFQIKEYSLQKTDKTFKPTPPFFSAEIVNKKRKGILWDSIETEFDNYYNSKA